MAKKRSKRKSKRQGPGRRLVTLLSLVTFIAVLVLAISTALRWIVPPRSRHLFGRDVIRVEVLNGCGEYGVAERVTDWLREEGFDIVYFGNADSFRYDETILFDRSGRPEFAREVADVLGCHNIEKRYDGLLLLDVTVIVGKDWRKMRLGPDEEGGWKESAKRLREMMEEWFSP